VIKCTTAGHDAQLIIALTVLTQGTRLQQCWAVQQWGQCRDAQHGSTPTRSAPAPPVLHDERAHHSGW
jgi:hypothetical protein